MSADPILTLVRAIFSVHEGELDCEGCDAEMPRLAELVQAGGDPSLLLPAVHEHLRLCRDCREEFEALLAIVRAEQADSLGG